MYAVGRGRDYSRSNLLILVFGIILLIAFIFLPWYGTLLVDNGARMMADSMYGTPGSPPAPFIWLIPIVSLGAILLGLLGTLRPENERLMSNLGILAGLVGVVYFILVSVTPNSMPRDMSFGLGYYICMAASIGLVLNTILTSPPVSLLYERPRAIDKPQSRFRRKLTPYLFLAPALILYFVWIIGPTFYTFYLSTTNWDGISAPQMMANPLAHYERLFTQDKGFADALLNNVRWLAVFITVPTSLGLLLAMVFNREMKGNRFFKVSFYLPLILSLPVIGLIWSWVYNPRLGLINNFLTSVLNVTDPPGWLGDREIAIWCVIIAAVWRQVGYVMVLYLAGLKNIDPQLMDAAQVDGAGRLNLFRYVLFPLLAPVTTIVVVISIIDSLRAFDLVAVMTRGGQNTQVLANYMYIESFNNYRMGYAAAIAVILFAISLVFIIFYLSRVVKDELEY
ncbi:MAG TPA: sugar ABC transporter permease [Anaerolineaceae bacterium]|nr:sugar ABC transporter permease [Anaerolineaceae bacterium]